MQATAVEAVQKVDEAKADEEVRVVKAISPGETIQQGDVYVHRVSDTYKHGKVISTGETQVAEGNTIGSRHVASGDIVVHESTEAPSFLNVPQGVEWAEMVGPVIEAKGKWALKHPEHANFTLPAGKYVVTYQYDPRTMKRTID